MYREKVKRFLQILDPEDNQRAFYLGICYTQLGNYFEAQRMFEKSCLAMLQDTYLWKGTGQPNWLVDICVLSGRKDVYPDVLRELDAYKEIPSLGVSPMAMYTYALIEYLIPSGWEISTSIKELLKRQKYKDMFAIGQALQAIDDQNSAAFENAITALLKAHEGMAKYGSLRETPEGLMCMSAMSLAYVAHKRDIVVDIENDYFSEGYLQFLVKKTNPGI